MGPQIRRPAQKREPKRVRVPLYVPQFPDRVCSGDFMSDTLADGRGYRTLNVVDDFIREALQGVVTTYSSFSQADSGLL